MTTSDQSRPKCPPQVKGLLSNMNSAMARDARYNNVLTPTSIIKELLEREILDGLPTFESWLRDMGSRVHLVGAPLDFYGPEWADKTQYMSFQPGKQGEPDFTLWVGLNGLTEATTMLTRLGITTDDNLTRLDTTGFLVVQQSPS